MRTYAYKFNARTLGIVLHDMVIRLWGIALAWYKTGQKYKRTGSAPTYSMGGRVVRRPLRFCSPE